ncbi:MAG: cytidylate kinase-like family protein [Desulfobacterales bacterium]|nr:cytidylate kinase-like family protein [Desulfobacterales bacterium]
MAVITISRQFGSGGKTIGEAVANRLGYTFLDDQIIQMVALKARVSENWVKTIEKEAGGKLLQFINGLARKSFSDRIMDDERGDINEEIYVDLLRQIIVQIAGEGNTVILGRGSQYILQEFEGAFHVLLVADMEHRVKFMQDRYGLSAAKALQTIKSEDRRRMNLYRKFGKQDYDQAHLYHLVLNMSKLRIEQACKLICDFVD